MTAAGAPLGVQLSGSATYADAGALRAAVLQAISDAGFSVSQFTFETPGWSAVDTFNLVTFGTPYMFTARFVVDAWTDNPTDSTNAIVSAVRPIVSSVATVGTFDIRTGQDTLAPAPPSASKSWNLFDWLGVSAAGQAVQSDIQLAIVGVVVIAIALAVWKPRLAL